MIHDDNDLDVIEDQARLIFSQGERDVPTSLDERIKAMAKRALEERQAPSYIFKSNFTLMAAADNGSGASVVITDKETGMELSVWAARGKKHSYLVEIKAVEGNKRAITECINHVYDIIVDGEIIFSGVIEDDHISEFIELDENRTGHLRWSFGIRVK
ncbi:MAG: hypothetical protein R3F02_04220 [Thiolinea sp.]